MIGFITESTDTKKKEFVTPTGEEDLVILAEDAVFSAEDKTVNQNVLAVGSTNAGKSMSVCEPRLLHTYNSSLVIPLVKRRLFDRYSALLESRGYQIIDLNLAHPELSKTGYDPCKGIKTQDDMLTLAAAIVGGSSKSMDKSDDPYWSESTTGCIAALMGLAKYHNNLTMLYVMELFTQLSVSYPNGHARTTLDDDFEEMEMVEPDAQAPRLWRALSGTASRTASCIVSLMTNALSKFCGEYGKALFDKPDTKMVSFKELGRRKTALFITTSATPSSQKISNILYADLIKQLFDEAEEMGGSLSVPVHILFDDFACGSKVEGFAEYLSVFRAARISCTILLQSLSQLSSLYGPYASTTILDNMDSMVFLGSLNYNTCDEFAKRAGMSAEEVLKMPVGDVIVSRRGWGTRRTKRYPTPEDAVYKKHIAEPDQIRE